jgi:hypothetical protein
VSAFILLFFVMSAHTLLGPFILMLMLVDHTLCLDQLYSSSVIMLSGLCTPVRHFVWPSFLYNLTLPTHTHGAHTVLGSVVLLYIYTLVKSLFTLGLCTQLHCTTVHSLVPAWPLFCQPITEEILFTCFALIVPLGNFCEN